MSSSKESSVHMRIYGLAKNILIALVEKKKKAKFYSGDDVADQRRKESFIVSGYFYVK